MRKTGIFSLMIAGILGATAAAAQDKPVLTVYTYDSFVAEWGPGPAVEKAFEGFCDCDDEDDDDCDCVFCREDRCDDPDCDICN